MFLLFLGVVLYDNEFETKENKIWTKDKIEPQHIHQKSHAIDKDNLLENQELLEMVIISFIVLTLQLIQSWNCKEKLETNHS